VKPNKKGQTTVIKKGAARRVLGFRVMEELGEMEGNGNRTRKEGGVTKKVMAPPKEGGRCQ